MKTITPSQDHLMIALLQDHHHLRITPSHIHQQYVAPLQDHQPQNGTPSPDHPTTADVCDIIALKSLPQIFDTIGNMPGAFTIFIDPSIAPIKHAKREAPIEERTH